MNDFGPCRTCGKPAECIARYCYPCLHKRHRSFGDEGKAEYAMQVKKGRRRRGPQWSFLDQKRGKSKEDGTCDPMP